MRATEPIQLNLFDEAALEHNGLSFGEWVESLADPADACTVFLDAECRWLPSCRREGCWRRECEQRGRPLYGIGSSARNAA